MVPNQAVFQHLGCPELPPLPPMSSQLPNTSVIWVPCLPNPLTGTFSPLYTMANYPYSAPPSRSKPRPANPINRGGLKHKPWTEAEDGLLAELVKSMGLKKWIHIAATLNAEFHEGETARKGKHCRERWYNHLDPALNSKS